MLGSDDAHRGAGAAGDLRALAEGLPVQFQGVAIGPDRLQHPVAHCQILHRPSGYLGGPIRSGALNTL
jgi:hypothetical protein